MNSDEIMVENHPFDAQEVQIGMSALAQKLQNDICAVLFLADEQYWELGVWI